MATRKKGLWESVYYAIVQSKTLTVHTFTYLPEERVHIDRILNAFLTAAGMTRLRNNLAYCVHELAGNAKKANIKRLYFREKELDILDAADYQKGMETFKTETTEQFPRFLSLLRENGLYVKFQFRKLRKGVRVTIRNNSLLAPAELQRIQDKVAVARRYRCLADAYSTTEDGSEGAGLGIVMMLFMLRNLGFSHDAFSIRISGSETVATLVLVPSQESGVEDGLAAAAARMNAS
ncbi:MAG TPA: hypothetical protein VMV03_16890 [Spirochaetia bacterium]|nr:hypothetical protein [Spirochaetia bacterium]